MKLSISTQKTLFLFITIFGSMWMIFNATDVVAHSGGEAISAPRRAAITIDGDLADWAIVRSLAQEITTKPQDWYQITAGGGAGSNTNKGGLRVSRGQIDGDKDLKVVWMTMWDDDNLYFAFETVDDDVNELKPPYEGRDARNFEGYWLCFDTKHNAPTKKFGNKKFNTAEVAALSAYEPDDTFWQIAPVTARGAGAAWVKDGEVAEPELNTPAKGHIATKRSGTGYTFEIRMPWKIFDPFFGKRFKPTDGDIIGFDITVMDIDPVYDPPQGGAMAWSSDFENDNSPGVLGDIIFSTTAAVNPNGKLPALWGEIKNGY
jgi:hypothetical protein